ncbi:MAG: energy transducer TonB, partial [Bacteroidota bacterium]
VQPSLESWSATLAARVHAELTRQEVVEMDKPPPPAPATPPPATPPVGTSAPRVRAPAGARRPANEPAAAARVVAAEPRADDPVDLTAEAIVTGTASAYAGGATSGSGNRRAPPPQTAGPPAPPVGPGATGPDRSSPVRLEADEWQCAWPREADSRDIDQQWVVLRVIVRADGSAESARLVSDPGHGFGGAAVACALRTRFAPARDRGGHPTRMESPPIRVRFTR